jgi:hypothetical protein
MWRAISRAPSWILVTSGLAELNAGDLGYLGSRVRFVPDSALEGDGFEPSVPQKDNDVILTISLDGVRR